MPVRRYQSQRDREGTRGRSCRSRSTNGRRCRAQEPSERSRVSIPWHAALKLTPSGSKLTFPGRHAATEWRLPIVRFSVVAFPYNATCRTVELTGGALTIILGNDFVRRPVQRLVLSFLGQTTRQSNGQAPPHYTQHGGSSNCGPRRLADAGVLVGRTITARMKNDADGSNQNGGSDDVLHLWLHAHLSATLVVRRTGKAVRSPPVGISSHSVEERWTRPSCPT